MSVRASLARSRRAALSFAALTPPERRAVVFAAVALALVARELRTGGLAAAERRLGSLPRALPTARAMSAERLATLVAAVARRVPDALCLARSLVLARLVHDATGAEVLVRIGVRPGTQVVDAHAWVEVDGAVVRDDPDVATRFTVIETRRPARGAR